MKKIWHLMAILSIGLLFVGNVEAVNYYNDFSSSSLDSFWTTSVNRGTVEVVGGYLVLTGKVGVTAYALVNSSVIGGTDKLNITFILKTDLQGTGSASYGASREWGLVTGDGKTKIIFFRANEKGLVLNTFDGQSISLPLTDAQNFVRYNFYFENGSILVFVNGTKVASVSGTFDAVQLYFRVNTWWAGDGLNHQATIWVDSVSINNEAKVTFSFVDGLTGSVLDDVTVKEGSTVLGMIDSGESLNLTYGTHTLTFEKQGYWSVTKTIDVQSDVTLNIEMYPDSAAFKLENFPAEIKIPENTLYTLTFTLSPIQTSATYNTYLAISGLSDIIEVRKDGSVVSPEGGKYYLGDISGPTQVSIKFKAGAVGTHGFTISIESHDAIMSKTYTTTKQVTYTVEPLPFSVQMPSEWQVGENQLRISESSGQSYLITAVLKDGQGNEVWSDSYAFSPYEAHTFQINVPAEGSYTLELTWNGQTAVYDVQVNPAITLVTKTLTVQEGGEGVITLHFKNPSSSVQYYTIKVSGGFLPAEINQSISVAPLTEKDVSIAFAVPEDLVYDAYELNVQVLQGDNVVFQDKVAVSISNDGGFSLFGGGGGTSTWAYVLLGLLVLGGVIWALRRR